MSEKDAECASAGLRPPPPGHASVHHDLLGGHAVTLRERDVPVLSLVDDDVVAGAELAAQELRRERVLDHALDGALQRPRAVDRIVAGVGDRLARGLAQLDREPALLEELAETAELDLHD